MKNKKDQGRQDCFRVSTGAFAGVGPGFEKTGPLTDLSMDGLAFRYIGGNESSDGSYIVVFMSDGSFYLDHLPFRMISDVEDIEEESFSYMTMRRCSVRFGELTPYQKTQLGYFIREHTTF